MNLASTCLYTIIVPEKLEAHARNKSAPLSEGTKWTRIEKDFGQAQKEKQELIVLFTDARRCDVLYAWAPLKEVRVGESTKFWLKGVFAFSKRYRKTDLTTLVGGKRISPKQRRPYLPCKTPAFLADETRAPHRWAYELEDFVEGRLVLRSHYARERSRALRSAKLQAASDLRCEVCEFDFGKRYPEVGEGFVEVHHKEFLANRIRGGGTTTLEELALVCANCHRMLHRKGLTVDALRDVVRLADAGSRTTSPPR
jgi:hypothetical protein